ncbi:MAG: LolA family protein [Methylococcales bacterium]
MRAKAKLDRIPGGLRFLVALSIAMLVYCPAIAEDSVGAVVERMKSTSAVRIAYRETRYLELFEKPVETSGMFYGMPPDALIKEQLSPSREVMGILQDDYYYYNPENGLHHSQARNPDDPMTLQLAALQALANGNQDLLRELYRISFVTEPGHWYMILSDRNESQSLVRITVSGSAGQPAERIEIHEADGERSVYRLEKDAEGEGVRTSVLLLEAELTGQ